MAVSRNLWRWAAMAVLGLVAAGLGFLMLVQALLVVFAPFGHWQRPGVAKVAVTFIERDQEGRINGKVEAREDGQPRILRFAKEEAATLALEEEVWILDNYFVGGARPDNFLLTPGRLLAEYPAPLLALALWLLMLVRRAQAREDAVVPDIPRKVWRDDFHRKAARFEPPGEPEEPK
jgi:hypothetical protein